MSTFILSAQILTINKLTSIFQPQNQHSGDRKSGSPTAQWLFGLGRRDKPAVKAAILTSTSLLSGSRGSSLGALAVLGGGGRRSGGLRREEAEQGGLGGLQGPVGDSPPLLPLPFLLPRSLCSLGHVVVWAVQEAAGGDLGSEGGGARVSWRRSLDRQWLLVILAGGVKYLRRDVSLK